MDPGQSSRPHSDAEDRCNGVGRPTSSHGERSPPRSSRRRSTPWWPNSERCIRPTSPRGCSLFPRHVDRKLAGLLEDDRLADLIEELPDDEAIRIIESLDVDRAAHVIEEMEPDDAADLLGDLSEEQRVALLGAMMPEESSPLRRLLAYDENTAGGLMTPEPLVLPATASVAEALAVARTAEMPAELAAQVFVVNPPTSTPTGTFLGAVGFQRLLREAPGTLLEHCIDDDEPEPVREDLPLRDVAERLASYDLLAVPVCDRANRLVGAVTVDDVLDQVLPDGWRRRIRR